MEIVLKGIIKGISKQEGMSKAGKPWSKVTVYVENDKGNVFPVVAFGDELSASVMSDLDEGMEVSTLVDLVSREYNGNHYLNLNLVSFSSESAMAQHDEVKQSINDFERNVKGKDMFGGFEEPKVISGGRGLESNVSTIMTGGDEDLPF